MSIQANFPAIKPTLLLDFANTEALDPRITYSRASTGTYYDGKTVAKAEENLLVRSDEFSDVIWTKDNSSVTTNSAVAPDGTTTADTVIASATTSTHRIYQTISTTSNISTVSVYAKAFGLSWVRLNYNGNATANFDLTNGVVGTVAAGTTATITAVGNGWYRCTTTTTNLSGNFIIDLGTSDAGTGASAQTFTGNGTSGIYLWGAQLEQRSSATAYAPTTTAPITNYIPVMLTAASGVPRFEHSPVTGESLGLLIEEQRTNLVTYSQDFDNAAWNKFQSATITANATTAPDGTSTADLLTWGTGTASGIYQVASSAFVSSMSVYAKTYSGSPVLLVGDDSGSRFAHFNLATGALVANNGTSSTSITPVGNGWYRLVVVFATSPSNIKFISGTGTVGSAYIWGAQLEAGAFATSYIPTVASQVTRAADSASMTGTNFSSWYNQSEGTLYADSTQALTTANTFALFSAGVNIIRLGSGKMDVFVAGTPSAQIAGTVTGGSIKQAGAYQVNDFAISTNGGAVSTDTSGAVPFVDSATFSSAVGNSVNGTIKRIAYYPVRVTNAQLQALTS